MNDYELYLKRVEYQVLYIERLFAEMMTALRDGEKELYDDYQVKLDNKYKSVISTKYKEILKELDKVYLESW